jgi:hypothetical protein
VVSQSSFVKVASSSGLTPRESFGKPVDWLPTNCIPEHPARCLGSSRKPVPRAQEKPSYWRPVLSPPARHQIRFDITTCATEMLVTVTRLGGYESVSCVFQRPFMRILHRIWGRSLHRRGEQQMPDANNLSPLRALPQKELSPVSQGRPCELAMKASQVPTSQTSLARFANATESE